MQYNNFNKISLFKLINQYDSKSTIIKDIIINSIKIKHYTIINNKIKI